MEYDGHWGSVGVGFGLVGGNKYPISRGYVYQSSSYVAGRGLEFVGLAGLKGGETRNPKPHGRLLCVPQPPK